ncbi:MAG: hypothetical protein K2O96_05835 [Lachnospiraceae bacterium]|nr:hypothetical protein [Lachnospiraceae bacterium]
MKKYNTNFIKSCIEEHKAEIKTVTCGMREDWNWTAETIFENGELSYGYDWSEEHISVAGISGSTWATPVMEVEFKDGRTEIVNCYEDDGERASQSQISQQKAFARATGGMDCI